MCHKATPNFFFMSLCSLLQIIILTPSFSTSLLPISDLLDPSHLLSMRTLWITKGISTEIFRKVHIQLIYLHLLAFLTLS